MLLVTLKDVALHSFKMVAILFVSCHKNQKYLILFLKNLSNIKDIIDSFRQINPSPMSMWHNLREEKNKVFKFDCHRSVKLCEST